MLFLDGVYADRQGRWAAWFHRVDSPATQELIRLAQTIARRIGRYLERQGLLERLCRCISRPVVAEKRLSLTPGGNVRYQLKTLYRDDTHVVFENMGLYRTHSSPDTQAERGCHPLL
jgi:hypothetical protein